MVALGRMGERRSPSTMAESSLSIPTGGGILLFINESGTSTSLLGRGVRKAADLTKPIDKRVYKVRFCLTGTWISNMHNLILVSS